ncbi:neutral zinc metallopeptidase [Lentzea sp. BCCO 10_0798]|uniref:Neutral zinc metallopeptidase n=1 Tax=Lentzea kristufekii TaxID=3095430 RepID=A0ABU4U559_9PSEU|nr:neutral zinc metallopeptidase [Lentzea sp. BCCO 10_0798]MDX8055646.1 neutral zinc metallopeptidase [Lentzea sp. BCCO 10_0798]
MTQPAKNNPVLLAGVFVLVVAFVLGIGQLSRPRVVTGHALAGARPASTPPTEPSTAIRPRAVFRLADHPLLVKPVSLTPVTCALPPFGTSDGQLAAYYAAGVECLDTAWGPLLTAANLPFDKPELDASPVLKDGPCGEAPESDHAVAYYCGRNRTIYMPTSRLRDNGGGDAPATHLATLSHEYGHHVQALTGLLRAADLKITDAGEKTPAGLEMSRRIELQANCFAGMFLSSAAGRGSLTAGLARQAQEDFQFAVEEKPENNAHGSAKNQAQWAAAGFKANSTDACNTFTASPAQVG